MTAILTAYSTESTQNRYNKTTNAIFAMALFGAFYR
jgi:hypothetical protein